MPVSRLVISGASARLFTVIAFVIASLVFFGYLWAQAGGYVPGLSTNRAYAVTFQTDNVGNAVPFTDVQVAGVPVGKVDDITAAGNHVVLHMSLDPVAAPLHQGVRVQISEKSLAGQPFVRVVDGTGPAIPDGAALPASAVIPPVTMRDVLASFDPATLNSLGGTVRGLGAGTDGRTQDISAVMAGLSSLGSNGNTALDAIAAQSADLQSLSGELTQVFDALDTGDGQIADLVSSANRLTSATAGQKANLEVTMRKLPAAMKGVSSTAAQFNRIEEPLTPIAANLRRAAPDLNAALLQLPGTAADLRGLLLPLQSVLDQAPTTLDKVPAFSDTVQSLIPPATSLLQDANPALRYLKPYGLDISQIFTNFGASFHHYDSDGASYVYLRPMVTPLTVRPNPVKLPTGGPLMTQNNAYPAPGGLADLRPFTGSYPRVERDN